MRIAVVNCYGDANRGSAALNMVAVSAAMAVDPAAEVGIVSIRDFSQKSLERSFRHTLREFPNVELLPPLLNRDSIRGGRFTSIPAELLTSIWSKHPLVVGETAGFLSGSDLIISRGGVIYDAPRGGEAGLLRRTSAMRFAQAKDIPTVHFGLHAMNIPSLAARTVVRADFSTSRLLLPRGPVSQYWVKQYAPEAASTRSPDSVVGLWNGPGDEGSRQRGHWALAVTNGAHQAIEQLLRLVEEGVSRGVVSRATLVAQVNAGDSDVTEAQELLPRLQRLVPTQFIGDDLTPHQLIDLYGTAELVLATRLHACIFGLLAGVPSLILPVRNRGKDNDVLSELGLSEFVLDQHTHELRWRRVEAALSVGASQLVSKAMSEAHSRHTASVALIRDVVT